MNHEYITCSVKMFLHSCHSNLCEKTFKSLLGARRIAQYPKNLKISMNVSKDRTFFVEGLMETQH